MAGTGTPTSWTESGDVGDGAIDNGRYAWTGTSGSGGNPTATLSQMLTVPTNTSSTTYTSTSLVLTQTAVATTNAITSIEFDLAWQNSDVNGANDNTLQVRYGGTLYATFTTGAGNGSNTGTWVYSNGASGTTAPITAVADATTATVATTAITITLGTPATSNGDLAFTFANGPSGGGSDDIVIDNVAAINTATTTTTVTTVDLASNGWTATYTENGAAVAIADTDSSIFDRDSANMASASIVLTNPQTGDRLLVNGSAAASGTLASGIAWTRTATTVTLSGSFSKALYTDAIELIQFENTTENPATTPRIINVRVNNGTQNSNTAIATINVVAVDNAPVFTGTAGASYTENAAAVAIVSGAAVSDVDAANFNGGSVTVALALYQSGDVLSINNQGVGAGQIGVSGANVTYAGVTIGTFAGGSAANLVISLNASATPAAVQALMGQLRYASSSDDPTALGTAPTRALTVTLNNGGNTGTGGALTASRSGTITITAVNDAPTVSAPASFTVTEDVAGNLVYTGTPFADPDNASLTVTLSIADGTISASTGGGVTVGGTHRANFLRHGGRPQHLLHHRRSYYLHHRAR